MTKCEAVCPVKSTYNAVNIKINNPKTNVSDKKRINENEGEYNAVNLEINNPEIKQKPIYSYPRYDTIVTADMVRPYESQEIPVFPVSYKTSFVNNRTYINADFDTEDSVLKDKQEVPRPYLTNRENEKMNLTFHGISFRASEKPQIVSDAKMLPAIDTDEVIDKLASDDFDVQARQLEVIISDALKDDKSAVPYISTPVFSGIIDIAERDTSALVGPTEEQKDIRKKIIANEITRIKQESEGKKPEEMELPYLVSEEEFAKASILSQKEMAERNKEYALLTLAALTKVYTDDFQAKTGNVVPLTDLPGASTMVETLRYSQNPSVKIAAIESLVYINRPEYNKEITAVLSVAAEDKNVAVATVAMDALKNIQDTNA